MMRLPDHFIALAALGLALLPAVATAEPISWTMYEVPETGAAVAFPNSIFTEPAGKPEAGYGGRFLTSDRRADLTVQSVANDAGLSPAVFLARKNLPRDIVYKRVTPQFFVVSSFRKGKDLVRPLQLCRALYSLRVDQLSGGRETPVG